MEWQKYLTSDNTILLGKPTIKGTRISVEHIIGLLAQGWTEQQILENYPRLTQESLQAVFSYIQECLKDGLLFSNVNPQDLKFLANENVPISSVKALRIGGFDIKSIGMDNPSISDKEVMNIAIEEVRTIITYDSDYGELIFKYGFKPSSGVIFIRTQPSEPLETAKIIEKLIQIKNLSFEGALTVVDSNSIRQKKY